MAWLSCLSQPKVSIAKERLRLVLPETASSDRVCPVLLHQCCKAGTAPTESLTVAAENADPTQHTRLNLSTRKPNRRPQHGQHKHPSPALPAQSYEPLGANSRLKRGCR